MIPTPFFSICLPTYNGKRTVEAAVESVLQQTFPDWHLTIIDDQSTDGTWEVLAGKYGGHEKIRLLRNERNLGLRGNLNRCLEVADGAWFGILGHDDAYRSHALETIHDQLEKRDDVVLWAHGGLGHLGGPAPRAMAAYVHVTEFHAADLAELLYKRGNIFGVLSSYFVSLGKVREGGISFADGEMLVDLRFYVRLLKRFPSYRAIYWPDLLVSVDLGETTAHRRLGRLGKAYVDLIEHLGDLADLGWQRGTLLYQLARLAKCSFKYRRQLKQLHANKVTWSSARALWKALVETGTPRRNSSSAETKD